MADYVRARITAAKVGVGLALSGLVAGVVERVRTQEHSDPASLSVARTAGVSVHEAKTVLAQLANKISSSQIKDHSLLYKDIKQHQVLPYSELKEIKALQTNFKLLGTALSAGLGTVYNKAQADSAFLAKLDTAVNANKLGGLASTDFVNGHGNVFSGVQHVTFPEEAKTLFTVPGVMTVKGNFSGSTAEEIQIFNLSNAPLTISWFDVQQHQDAVPVGTVSFDLPVSTDIHLITAQVLTGDGRPITLTVSFVPDGTGQGNFVGQALAAP